MQMEADGTWSQAGGDSLFYTWITYCAQLDLLDNIGQHNNNAGSTELEGWKSWLEKTFL